jgi:hypothetical protein
VSVVVGATVSVVVGATVSVVVALLEVVSVSEVSEVSGVRVLEVRGVLVREVSGVLDREVSGVLDREVSGVLDREVSGVLVRDVSEASEVLETLEVSEVFVLLATDTPLIPAPCSFRLPEATPGWDTASGTATAIAPLARRIPARFKFIAIPCLISAPREQLIP